MRLFVAADLSAGAVISVPERRTKENFGRPAWRVATAICDPELTLTVPPKVTVLGRPESSRFRLEAG